MWKEDKDEIIAHEWMTLKLLWDRCKANAADKLDHDKIDALFSEQQKEQQKWSSRPQDSKLSTFGFDDAMKLYLTQPLLLRLLYGMIGAIIFYYFLCSGLIDGSAFPKLSDVADDHLPDTRNVQGTSKKELGLAELDVLAPTVNLAKLLVWSFIAGFSEGWYRPLWIASTSKRKRPKGIDTLTSLRACAASTALRNFAGVRGSSRTSIIAGQRTSSKPASTFGVSLL
jgi:hypothetical protein